MVSKTIKKGKHYASGCRFFPFITKKNFDVLFRFDNSCKYSGSDQLNQQWNKLFGIGKISHHIKSDRLVWRYNEPFGLIEIARYNYRQGKRQPIKSMGYVRLNSWNRIKIITERYWFGKYLNFYFGGIQSAPHDITIKIKSL
jgi:hypothetical protein